MMDTFKKNSEWSKVRVVMADKDVGERDVVKNPSPQLLFIIPFILAAEI